MQKLSDTEEEEVANTNEAESSLVGKSHLHYPLYYHVLKHHELALLVI